MLTVKFVDQMQNQSLHISELKAELAQVKKQNAELMDNVKRTQYNAEFKTSKLVEDCFGRLEKEHKQRWESLISTRYLLFSSVQWRRQLKFPFQKRPKSRTKRKRHAPPEPIFIQPIPGEAIQHADLRSAETNNVSDNGEIGCNRATLSE